MSADWNRVTLGRSGLSCSPLGIGSSFGVGARDLERAFERGINYFYWGSIRRPDFGRGLKRIAARDRDRVVIAVQTYSRVGALMRPSVESALRSLGTDHADILILGWWNDTPPQRILDAAQRLKERGRARHLLISCHDRSRFAQYAQMAEIDAIMVRYNAAHPGAEQEVFPLLGEAPPGVVAYTATRWGDLLRPELMPEGEPTPRASDCYRFALAAPAVDVCLAGPKDGAELDEALAALDRGPMSAEELAWMRRVGQEVRRHARLRSGAMGAADRVTGGA